MSEAIRPTRDTLRPLTLEKPGLGRTVEFLQSVERSRKLHGHFVELPVTPTMYRRYVQQKTGSTDIGHFIITADDRLAGVININEISRGSSQSAQLGYYLFAPFQGHGLMKDALDRIIERAFLELGLHRLEANIQPDNIASLKLVDRAGFHREGFSPRFLLLHGQWRDHERWALTREDWVELHQRINVRI